MKASSVFVGLACAIVSFNAEVARGFSISAVNVLPTNPVPANAEVRLVIDIVTPGQGTWLYAPTQVSSNASSIRVDVFPTSGMLAAIGSLRETVTLGVFPPGTHHYEVAIHPNFTVNWGTRTNRGSFTVTADSSSPTVPLVSISGVANVQELCPPNADCVALGFQLRRTAPGLDKPLTVFLLYGGTATRGSDYAALPTQVEFQANQETLAISSNPIDDTLYEGDETIVVQIIQGLDYQRDPNRGQATAVILDNEPPAPPIVSLELDDGFAQETRIDQGNIDPGVFRLSRTGPTTEALTIFLNASQGSARLGDDYWIPHATNGTTLRLPAGERSLLFGVYPLDDDFYEGDETAFLHLIAPPPGTNPYTIDFPNSQVAIVIRDNDPVTTRLDITAPRHDQHFQAGETIELRAQIIGPGSTNSWTVEFFDGNRSIGTTRPGAAIWWRDAIGGQHIINARAAGLDGVVLDARPVTIFVGPGPAVPVVSIHAAQFRTAEPCPVCLVAPGVFTISRTGPTTEALTVYLQYDGTATPGLDYHSLPHLVSIPPGTNAARVLVLPNDDLLVEGPEIVRATLVSPEMATLGYVVSHYSSEAMVVINDDEPGAPDLRLDIVEPREGAQFATGTTIEISALGVWTQGEVDRPVQFFAGNLLIGQSQPPALGRPTIPGLPSVHTIFWTNPPTGQHALTARFEYSFGEFVTSPRVNIAVGDATRTIVSIEATREFAEESSYPYRRMPLRGEFTISRSGPTTEPLNVFVHYSGTATPGVDYPALPFLARIPAGATSTRIEVVPNDDGVPEGIETLIATLSHCPPDTVPPMGIPCYGGFDINPSREHATVFIRDDGITQASLTITNPQDGATFSIGQTIPIEAVAIDLNGYINHVEFFDGNTLIGVSQIEFIRAPDPGTPIYHSFDWRGAAAGEHVLTARAVIANDPFGNDVFPVVSEPVHITVGPTNRLPRALIVSPTNNAQFPPNTAVEIVAETQDPDGYVRRMEFFADGRKIGESSIDFIQAPEPGQWQKFTFLWQQPAPGRHTLTVRPTDNRGATTPSPAIEISVGTSEPLPIVTVAAPDCFAVEPGSNSVLNTATFRIRRFGPTNDALVVAYSLRGTAENGTDYETLSGLTTIPAGNRFIDVTVRPLADRMAEGIESVVLRVEEPPPPSPEIRVINPYRVGRPQVAVAVISDGPWQPLYNSAQCVPLADGFRHICFTAETGRNYRIEGTVDLRNWQTLGTIVCSDGTLHFVDADGSTHPRRFYRLTPEPAEQVVE